MQRVMHHVFALTTLLGFAAAAAVSLLLEQPTVKQVITHDVFQGGVVIGIISLAVMVVLAPEKLTTE